MPRKFQRKGKNLISEEFTGFNKSFLDKINTRQIEIYPEIL